MNKYVWETADEIDLALAERAKKIRKRRGISQEELSKRCGVSFGSIKRFETLREQYEAGNISAVDFVIQQSPEITEDYNQFCRDEGLDPDSDSAAKAFMDFREELFEESISN